MASGFFFEPVLPSHDKGIITYRYFRIQGGQLYRGDDPLEWEVEYPINVILKKEGITFYIHHRFSIYQPKKLETDVNFFYGAATLLHLPISDQSQDELTDILSKFSILSSTPKEKDKYRPILHPSLYAKEKVEMISYSSLACFSIEGDDSEAVYLHDILLNFLFDFFHGNVFDHHPYYRRLSSRLKDFSFTKALVAKADFYYYQEYLNQLREEEKIYGRKNEQTELKLRVKAEDTTKEWLKTIREKDAITVIHPKNNWFNDLEIEHRDVFRMARLLDDP